MTGKRRTWTSRQLLAVALWAVIASGCTLFTSEVSPPSRMPLPPLVGPRDVVELEVYFVDRSIGDPMIGESLWGTLFAVTSVAPNVRESLAEDGFRFAMGPARPTRTLQGLLKTRGDQDPTRRTLVQRYQLPMGQEAHLITSEIPDGTVLTQVTDDGVKTTELNNGRSLLRVTAERVEDGWVNLVIIPEIRHGAYSPRPMATDQEWIYTQGQQSMPFYRDRLGAQVNIGEIVVLGLDPRSTGALARHFFRSESAPGLERLIMIRVADMKQIQPVRASRD